MSPYTLYEAFVNKGEDATSPEINGWIHLTNECHGKLATMFPLARFSDKLALAVSESMDRVNSADLDVTCALLKVVGKPVSEPILTLLRECNHQLQGLVDELRDKANLGDYLMVEVGSLNEGTMSKMREAVRDSLTHYEQEVHPRLVALTEATVKLLEAAERIEE